MKIVKVIALLMALPLAFFIYLTAAVDSSWAGYIVPWFVGLIILYMFSPQVEWWWAQSHPPKPSPNMIKFLKQHFAYFRELSGPDKDKFLLRLNYFIMAKDFKAKVGDDVPVPLQTMIAAEGVRTTFGLDDYLIGSHEHVVIYPHPFPSPVHQKLHHSETDHEDGVLVFASAPVVNQFKGLGNIFNIALYEWITAFRHTQSAEFPVFKETDWQKFTASFLTPKLLVEASIGLSEFDMSTVGAVLYLSNKDLFRKVFPAQAKMFREIFNQ